MKAGADPNKKNKNLWAPIHMACYFNQPEAITWILFYNKSTSYKRLFNLNEFGGKVDYTPL